MLGNADEAAYIVRNMRWASFGGMLPGGMRKPQQVQNTKGAKETQMKPLILFGIWDESRRGMKKHCGEKRNKYKMQDKSHIVYR